MIKHNQKLLNNIHLCIDAIVVIIAYIVAWYIKFEVDIFQEEGVGALSQGEYFAVLYYVVPIYIVVYSLLGLYTPKRTIKRKSELWDIIRVNLVGVFCFFAILYVLGEVDYSRTMIIYFAVVNVVLASIYRFLLRTILQSYRQKGYNLKHVLLVGNSETAKQYIKCIEENPEWGYKIYGILDDHLSEEEAYSEIPVLGKVDDLANILEKNDLDEIAITISLHDYDKLEKIVAICEKSGVHTKFIPDYNNVIPTKPYTEDVDGLPVIHIRHVPLTSIGNRIIKRWMDILGAIFACVLFSPIMLVCILGIKLSSKGPILFKQERIGLNNRPFCMYKFRSMVMQTVEDEAKGWTVKNDPRVTKIGKLMRKTSMDELPQLFNILRGEMSLVGPRPERTQFVEQFKESIPRYMIKHQVRPGMTGWAQIKGYRGDTSIKKRIELDIYYIENWTPSLDIRILFTTIFIGFINKNAY